MRDYEEERYISPGLCPAWSGAMLRAWRRGPVAAQDAITSGPAPATTTTNPARSQAPHASGSPPARDWPQSWPSAGLRRQPPQPTRVRWGCWGEGSRRGKRCKGGAGGTWVGKGKLQGTPPGEEDARRAGPELRHRCSCEVVGPNPAYNGCLDYLYGNQWQHREENWPREPNNLAEVLANRGGGFARLVARQQPSFSEAFELSWPNSRAP